MDAETAPWANAAQGAHDRVGYGAAGFCAAGLVFLVQIVFGHAPLAVWLLMGSMLAVAAGALTGLVGARRWGTALAALAAQSQAAYPFAAFGQLYGALFGRSARETPRTFSQALTWSR